MKNFYKKTLNLPQTSFSMRGNLINNELNILKKWDKIDIYSLVRKSKNKKKIFFLHDGPPYANGNIHIGHAVNKILKDIIIKSKGLSGLNCPFIAGWDCHGLPIELKVNEIFNNKILLDNFYKISRKYALSQIENQKNDFIRLGILSDWNNSYSTMNYKTESNIIKILEKLFNLGFLKRYNKPVYWCLKCKSSISDLETKHYNILCKSIYAMFNTKNVELINKIFKIKNVNNKDFIFFVSWTTTYWTIIDSQAISINPDISYCLIKYNNKFLIISEDSIKNLFKKKNNINYKILSKTKGINLLKITCIHPITNIELPIVINNLIESEVGTGIVNISPGHGLIDYEIGLKNNLKIINNIDDYGFYNNNIFLKKKDLSFNLINTIKDILNKNNKLFFYEEFHHKYPHCNRHKYPILFRLTYQWFIDLDHNKLRERAINYSQNVNWIPEWGKKRIKDMLINRPDWCISRQRKWGVPITFFINKKTNEIHPNSYVFFKKICKIVKKNGVEGWFNLDKKKFLKKNELDIYEKSNDILDVWFDSGTTLLSTIIYEKKINIKCADLYLEGSDQYRGWFMSSLLIFVAIKNKCPYKNIITHGFVLDNINEEKMSKSLGNVINVKELLKKNGADIIRLWVACSDYTKDLKISNETLNRVSDIYRRIRNTIKFLLSNLYDFNEKVDIINFNKLIKIDKWIINKLYNIQNDIIKSYNDFNFHKAVDLLNKFCSIYLGSIYLEIIKDRQYTLNKNSYSRKSSQTAIYHIIESIVRLISPILSFTSDEIWDYIPGKRSKTIFTEEWYKGLKKFNKNEKFNDEYWKLIFNIKNKINLIIEEEINKKNIKNSLEIGIILFIKNNELFNKLLYLKDELNYAFIVSYVKIIKITNNINNNLYIKDLKIYEIKFKILKFYKKNKCYRCWNFYMKKLMNNKILCNRCSLNINKVGKERKYI